MLSIVMSIGPTFLDGPYRPRPRPSSGFFRPLTKVIFTTAIIGALSVSAAAALALF